MTDKKMVPTLAHMAANPKERANTSRALADIGDRHELIIKALQEGYSFRDIAESLKLHDGIDVSPETIRRHYRQHARLASKGGKKHRRNSAAAKSTSASSSAQARQTAASAPHVPAPTAPQPKAQITHAGPARLGRTP